MKKLSFFLMAMLFSVMSFAAESLQVTMDFTKNTWGFPVSSSAKTSATKTYTNGEYTITLSGGGDSNGHYWNSDGYLMNGKSGATLTLPAFTFKTTKIVVTGRNGASASTKQNFYVGSTAVSKETTGATTTYTYEIAADYQAAGNVYIYKVTSSHNTQITKIEIYGEAESGEQTETVNAPKFNVTEANFTEAFTLNITSDEGTTLKYTTDNTDPKTSATAVVVNTNTASVNIPAKSTAVKAVAIKGELVSIAATMTYCYVNSAATAYTVAEAKAVIDAGLGLENELYVKGTISKIESFNSQYGSITYWIADEAGNQFECYSGLGLNKAKFSSKDDIEVGAYVVACGIMKKYNTTYEFNYNNYLVEYVAPVVNHTITVTATAEGEDVVTGGGEYEEGEEVTVTASEDLEGWVFIGWTEDGEFVANDPEYTFVVKGDVELVAVYAMDLGENEVTDLVIDGDNMLLTGSVAGFPMGTMNLELALGEYDDEEGVFLLTEESKLYVGETNFTFVDGMAVVDMNTNSAMAIVVFEHNGTYYYMTVNMSKKIEATVIEIDNATVTIEERSMGFGDEVYHVLKMESTWSDGETTYPVLLETTEFDQTKESQEVAASITVGGMGDEDPWLGNAEGDVTITVANGVVTVEGLLENPYAWPAPVAFDFIISGTLPVEKIAYELNGGAFPEVKVPTNAELWEAFKPYYNEYYGLNRADQTIENAATFAATYMQKIMTDEASAYKWLGDYIQSVATAAGKPLSTDMAAVNESGWRWSVWAFLNACEGKNGSSGIDFTEAGKPENCGPAYQAAHEVVLPTEPVDAPYTLPTPVKEGYTFVGWYDNAEGTGEAYTVIPAGWAGTLYAIWVEIYTITVEAENGTVEGAGKYEHGAEATLTATPAEGYEFTCWTSGKDTVSTANPYKFTVTADLALVANFELIPPTKYTVTLSDNTGGSEPLTSGAGEYEEGDEVTVSAVDSEGWVFVGWMDENGDIVSNDYQYTFVIEGNVELVAIYAQLMELEVYDLEIITEPIVGLTGTAELMPGMTLSFELIVDDSEQGDDGEYYLTEDSKVYLNDETELEFLEGIALIDMTSNTAQAQVLAAMGETLYLFKLDMSAAAAEPTNVLVTNAVKSYDEESGALKLTGLWEGVEVFVEIAGYDGKESIEYSTLQGVLFETPDVAAFGNEASIIVAGEDITVVCNGLKPNMGNDVYNLTITTLSEVSTALDNLNTTVAPVKMIENGQLIIVKNGVQFNAQGQVIK